MIGNIYQLSDPSKFAKLVELLKHYRRQLPTMLARPFLAELKKWIEDCTPLLSSGKYKMSTKVHWILNGLLFFPFCQHCHSYAGYVDKNVESVEEGYLDFCCMKCSQASEQTKQHKIDTSLKHFGVKYAFQAEPVKAKIHKSVKATTGYECALSSLLCREKGKQTTKKKIGYEYWAQSPECQEIHQQNNLKKFGKRHWSQTSEFKAQMKQIANERTDEQRAQSNAKREQTCESIYGVKHYTQSAEYKQLMQNPLVQENRKEKVHQTKVRNHTFKSSKQEDIAYSLLKALMPALQRQFRSKDYPFAADFYDPDQPNVRFEFNGSWTHGKMLYVENDVCCQKQLEKWMEKAQTSKYYENAVNTWTVRDPNKRATAKANNIQLVEFWSLEDVKDYVSARSK